MLTFLKTNSKNPHFINLVQKLDNELAVIDGNDHSFYAQFNTVDKLKNVIVCLENNQPISCGAIKQLDSQTMEIKRMYTISEKRGAGIASKIVTELENWVKELNYKRCVLETGIRKPDAIRLYEKCGFIQISNYDPYKGIENSVCFEKKIE